jgi:hypothetical protein
MLYGFAGQVAKSGTAYFKARPESKSVSLFLGPAAHGELSLTETR